jgi:hypothetical protein
MYAAGSDFKGAYMFWAFLLASVGMTHILVDAALPPLVVFRSWVVEKGPDWLKKLVSCYQCMGVWSGFVLGAILHPLPETPWLVDAFVCGCASSYASMAAAALLNYLDRPWGGDDKPKA